jgi:hypothetical protein
LDHVIIINLSLPLPLRIDTCFLCSLRKFSVAFLETLFFRLSLFFTSMASGSEQQKASDSTVSDQGSEPLSDVYIAVEATKSMKKGMSRWTVKALEGSIQLEVRRSTCVASARSKSYQVATLAPMLIKAPPGMKPSAGYQYQVLPSVEEQIERPFRHSGGLIDPSGKVDGSRDIFPIQASSKVSTEVITSRKQSATSNAPGSLDQVCNPAHLASAVDFSPSHFIEPLSDGLLGAWQEVTLQNGQGHRSESG